MDGCQKEGGNFCNLLQKGGRLPQKRMGGGEGVPTLEETMYVQSFMLDGSRRICFISQLKEFDDGNDARIVRWMCKVEPEDRISAVGHRKRPELETMRDICRIQDY